VLFQVDLDGSKTFVPGGDSPPSTDIHHHPQLYR
jgi:hypothetical protein